MNLLTILFGAEPAPQPAPPPVPPPRYQQEAMDTKRMKAIAYLGDKWVLLTVHDELICETPDTPEFTARGLASILSNQPEWAEGMPLAAGGWEGYRYKKD